MASTIWEFFGYRADDTSPEALSHAANSLCPITKSTCVKTFNDRVVSGVCSLMPITSDPVICCPIRLYGDDYKLLSDISRQAFEEGLHLVPSADAIGYAKKSNKSCVAVFGKGWGRELRLPQKSGSGGYFVDWVLAKINNVGELVEFVAVEVQTIDSTGNYRNGHKALLESRSVVKTSAGLNWENVSKRILPQLVYKGQILQREELCKKGLFFVCPIPVYTRIMKRLGGQDALPKYALQPASITFVTYDYDLSGHTNNGELVPVVKTNQHSTTIYKVQEAFNNVTLPTENVYKDAIIKALGL